MRSSNSVSELSPTIARDLPADSGGPPRQTVLQSRTSANDDLEDALLRMKDLVEHALRESRQRQTTVGALISRYPIDNWRGVAGQLLRSSPPPACPSAPRSSWS
jgi:hypothetical protein